jgi:secretion/DNA translocation related TadE-like protein
VRVRRRREGGRDGGLATVTVVGLGTALSGVGVAGVLLGGVVAARHRAGAAADFAAIAAAEHRYDGAAAACRAAARLAIADGAVLESCRLRGDVAEVQVSVRVGGPFAGLGPARATARAGPAATPVLGSAPVRIVGVGPGAQGAGGGPA